MIKPHKRVEGTLFPNSDIVKICSLHINYVYSCTFQNLTVGSESLFAHLH